MSDHLRSLLFAAAVCVVCSLLLTAAYSGLRERQMRNVALDRQRNLLRAAGLLEPNVRYEPAQIQQIYEDSVRRVQVDQNGAIVEEGETAQQQLPLYIHEVKGEVVAYIVPITTRGLWGRISGYMAIDDDGSTIKGFTVYQHSETPGLGGEIEKRWFQRNFIGKQIVNREDEFVSVKVARGKVDEMVPADKRSHYVDGISGATLTGRFLSMGLEENLSEYEPVSIRFRQGRGIGFE